MPATAENPPEVALDRKTQIAIPGGLHLLYNPEALDRWIPRKVEPCEGGGYKDNETGERLSQDDEADFMLYQQRLCDRYRLGEIADRLVQIVDRYMPRVADENRAYVMRYPSQKSRCLRFTEAGQQSQAASSAGGTEVDQWPWGAGGRPSDRDDATGRLAAKPKKYEAMHSHGKTKKPATGTRDEGGQNTCEPGPQPQLPSAPSASAHGKKAERHDKVQY